MRQLGGGVGVVSAFSIRIPGYEKPVLKKNGLSVLGGYRNVTPYAKTFSPGTIGVR